MCNLRFAKLFNPNDDGSFSGDFFQEFVGGRGSQRRGRDAVRERRVKVFLAKVVWSVCWGNTWICNIYIYISLEPTWGPLF